MPLKEMTESGNQLARENHLATYTSSAPGRICLFGEHQDYLGLPIIASAISRRFYFEGQAKADGEVRIHLRDLGVDVFFDLSDVTYDRERDYFKSVVVVLRAAGYDISRGVDAEGWSEIPIEAGVSSSSAMVNAWMVLILIVNGHALPEAEVLGELAYRAEVLEFDEPGGQMDQFTTAIGGTIYMESRPKLHIRMLTPVPGDWVLVQSGQPKDTIEILRFARDKRLRLSEKIKMELEDFDWLTATAHCPVPLTDQDTKLYEGTIRNRDILVEALEIMTADVFDPVAFGEKLVEHHMILSSVLNVSTEWIDEQIEICLGQGALGGKIVGSGGGGCFILYAPNHADHICKIMHVSGLEAWKIGYADGVQSILSAGKS